MAAQEAQVLPAQQLTSLDQYEFSGDSTTVANKRLVVEGYRVKASIYHAAQFAGIHRATVHRYINEDPEFAQAMEDAHEDSADVMESSVYERALTKDPILAMFWLKAHRPKFRDKVTIDVEVVKSEIEERMQQLNLRQLPAMTTTQFLDVASGLQGESLNSSIPIPVIPTQFPSQPEQIQKDDE